MRHAASDLEYNSALLEKPSTWNAPSPPRGPALHLRNMSVSLKTPEEIQKMRVAGRLAAEVLDYIEPLVKPGVTTGEIDRLCHEYIVNEQDSTPAPLNY